MKKPLLIFRFLVLLLSVSFIVNGQYTGTYDNIAAFKKANALDSIPGFEPSKAVDTLLTTWAQIQGNVPVWLEIELGSYHYVDGFGMVLPNANELPTSIKFQTSLNRVYWVDRTSKTVTLPGTYDYYLGGPVIAKYVRFYITSKDNIASFSEVKVYGDVIVPPTPPMALPASDITGTGFTAHWTDRAVATGYRINVSTKNDFSSYVEGYRDLDVGNVLSVDVSGLSPMTNYYYRVEAYNIVGPSGVSNTRNVTTIKLSQSITFDELAGKSYGDTAFSPGASASSGLPIGYTSSNETVAMVTNDLVTIIGIGETIITASQEGDSQYEPAIPVTQTLVVFRKELTVDGVTADNKEYDGTTDASISGGNLVGVLNGEDVSLTKTDLAKFTQADAGTGISVVTSMALSGADTSNYVLIQPVVSADIISKELSVIGTVAANKQYDATTTAILSGASLSGVLGSDDVGLSNATSGAFAQSDVGNNIVVSTFMSLVGADSANYSLQQPSLLANITQKELTITAEDKSREKCAPNPDFTVIYSGFAGDEDQSVLNQLPVASSEADQSSSTGTYDIVASGGGSANYSLVYINGILTITPDVTQPELAVQDITIQLDASENASITAADVVISAADNCSLADTILSQYTFNSRDIGEVSVLVTLTDVSGNSAIEIITVTVEDYTGYNELNKLSFSIFPNPTEGKVQLDFNTPPEELSVLDITGRMIITRNNLEPLEIIDLSEYNSGIYLFRFKIGEEFKHIKVIKK